MGKKVIIPIITTILSIAIIISVIPKEKSQGPKETTDYLFPPPLLDFNHNSSYITNVDFEYYNETRYSFLDYFNDRIDDRTYESYYRDGSFNQRYSTRHSVVISKKISNTSYYTSYNPNFYRVDTVTQYESICESIYRSIIENNTNDDLRPLEWTIVNSSTRNSHYVDVYQMYDGNKFMSPVISLSVTIPSDSRLGWFYFSIGTIFLTTQILPDEINVNYSNEDHKNYSNFVYNEYRKFNTTLFNIQINGAYPWFEIRNGHICNKIYIESNIFNKWRDKITITLYVDVFTGEPVTISRIWNTC